mmetsp:Transcript_55427/g.172326  ORF Transcript_55427/g.172326 Transcript_55427/m.172326 type:complete len:200 (-) Transcript_55427:105-704(-)
MAELPVAELVDLKADHLHLPARFEQVDQVLLGRLNGDVADPERVPVWRLHALGPVAAAVGGRLGLRPSTACGLGSWLEFVHVRIVDRDSLAHELIPLPLHRLVDAVSVLKLHMREVPPDMAITDADLCDRTAILEEVANRLLLWLSVHPSDPDRPTTVRLWSAQSLRPWSCKAAGGSGRPPVALAFLAAPAAGRLPSSR